MPLDPFRPIRLGMNLDREIEAAFAELIDQPWGRGAPLAGWQPAVDVFETTEEYLVEVDLPGVLPSDVQIQLGDRELSLQGHRRSFSVRESNCGVRLERAQGDFRRTITFEQPIDRDRVEIRNEQGILHLRLPKRRQ